MRRKIFALILGITCIFSLLSCGNTQVTIESISVVTDSIPEVILNTEIDDKIDDIQLKVLKSDGKEETIQLNKTMISDEDYSKLSNEGTHNITITYEGVTTNISIVISLPVDNRYSVKVVYPDNTPVTSGVTVQWCTGNNCFLPQAVNSEGIAYIELEDGEYYVHIDGIPAGYTYNPNAYVTDAENKAIEIKLLTLSEISSGDGSKENPLVVSEGTFKASFDAASRNGMKYFSFTTTEAGTYTIESIVMDKLALNVVDPYIGFVGTDISSNPDTAGNDVKDSYNFIRTFEAEANTTYYFIIMISSADKFPCSVEFTISK